MPHHPPTSHSHWRVYRIGLAGRLVTAAINALLPFLAGIGGAFILILATGLIAEEKLLDPPTNAALDQLSRAAIVPVLALPLGLGILTAVLAALREEITSRALARAAADGAPRTAVPHPSQIDRVAADPPYSAFFLFSAILTGLGLLFTLVAAFSVNGSEMYILWGSVAVTTVAAVFVVLALIGRPQYRRRRMDIAAHWTTADEQAAWSRAAAAPSKASKGSATGLPDDVQRATKRASRFQWLGLICGSAGFSLLQVWGLVTHPNRTMTDAGPRAEYGDGTEAVLSVGTWTFAVLLAAAVVSTVLGLFAESAVQRGEQGVLREALSNPAAPRPPHALLRKYAESQPVRLAQGLTVLASLGITFGWAVYILGTGGMDDVASLYEGARETFGSFVPQAQLTLAASVAVVVIALVWNALAADRGDDLRRQVVERWPIKPAPRMVGETGKKKPDPASIGPSLSPQPQPQPHNSTGS
ncbi:MAG TPA: hypothetical protein VIP77_19060 [Jiangellaceae bacterium]